MISRQLIQRSRLGGVRIHADAGSDSDRRGFWWRLDHLAAWAAVTVALAAGIGLASAIWMLPDLAAAPVFLLFLGGAVALAFRGDPVLVPDEPEQPTVPWGRGLWCRRTGRSGLRCRGAPSSAFALDGQQKSVCGLRLHLRVPGVEYAVEGGTVFVALQQDGTAVSTSSSVSRMWWNTQRRRNGSGRRRSLLLVMTTTGGGRSPRLTCSLRSGADPRPCGCCARTAETGCRRYGNAGRCSRPPASCRCRAHRSAAGGRQRGWPC